MHYSTNNDQTSVYPLSILMYSASRPLQTNGLDSAA